MFATGVVDTDKFAAGIIDTGGKFAINSPEELVAKFAVVSLISVANLPLVSLIPAKNFAAGVVDNGGKFATGGAP